MTIAEIIDALTPYTGKFPEAAVRAAIEQSEAIAPHLVRALEEVAEAPGKYARPDYTLHLFAAFLLGQFREKQAYRPLTRMLAAPGDIPYNLFGDTITERLKNILASVYDGDPGPIQQLIEGDEVEEYVRGAAVNAFMVLAHTQQIPFLEVVEYYRSLFGGKLRREEGQVWNDLACAVGDLPAPDLIPDLRQAYEEGLVDPGYAELEDLEQEARTPFEKKPDWRRERVSLVADAISEMSWWAAFKGDNPEVPLEVDEEPDGFTPSEPVQDKVSPDYRRSDSIHGALVRRSPKIGRNDPCPCGSGKKYKKCCGANSNA
jgi:hypothetical protein